MLMPRNALGGGRVEFAERESGPGKRLGTAFAEMRESLTPNFVAIVVRFVDRKSWIHIDEDTRFRDFAEALDALRAA
jgi:hypothetical protein